MIQNISSEEYDLKFPKNSHLRIMGDSLLNIKNPTVLEFGVERGTSTKSFIWLMEKLDGKIYSVDIKDCSNISNSKNWFFLKSNDLKINYVLDEFKEIKNIGVDLIYIDSYHENFHVNKLLNLYFKYLKKNRSIFIDDIDNKEYRDHYSRKKRFGIFDPSYWRISFQCIVYDLIDEATKEFYYNNFDKTYYIKYFGENGLGRLDKISEFLDEPNAPKKLWNYNLILRLIYPYLKKLRNLLKFIKN